MLCESMLDHVNIFVPLSKWLRFGKGQGQQTNKNSFLGVGPCCGYDDDDDGGGGGNDGCVEL